MDEQAKWNMYVTKLQKMSRRQLEKECLRASKALVHASMELISSKEKLKDNKSVALGSHNQ